MFLWSNKAFFSNVIVQKVPTSATFIDLPTLASSENVKESHKDFYGDAEKADEEEKEINSTLIDKQF